MSPGIYTKKNSMVTFKKKISKYIPCNQGCKRPTKPKPVKVMPELHLIVSLLKEGSYMKISAKRMPIYTIM